MFEDYFNRFKKLTVLNAYGLKFKNLEFIKLFSNQITLNP
jgi:hypothetical protein